MRLIPWEEERLQLFAAAELARRHRAAGVLLNQPETVAIVCDAMLEAGFRRRRRWSR
jgi:urease gamma subunit